MTNGSTDSSAHGAESEASGDGDKRRAKLRKRWKQARIPVAVAVLVVGLFAAAYAGFGNDSFKQLVAIVLFFLIDLVWRRLVITEGGYLIADLALFAVLESGFLLAHRVINEGARNVPSQEVFKVLAALSLYGVLLFILTQLKQKNLTRMAKGFAELVNRLATHHEREISDSATDEHDALIKRHVAQRKEIELVREMAVDTVWVTVFSKELYGARRERAQRVVDLVKELSGEDLSKSQTRKLKLGKFYEERHLSWSIGAGLCTLLVIVAAIFPVH